MKLLLCRQCQISLNYDTKAELNKYAKTWGLTHWALAIHNAIKKHKGNKKGGFLSVWPSDEEINFAPDNTSPTADVDTSSADVVTTSATSEDSPADLDTISFSSLRVNEKIKGKNNRSITVLFEGAGDYSGTPADPLRSPNSTEMLSKDQSDLLALQISQSGMNNRSLGAQTVPVVVTNTVEELQDLVVKPQLVDSATQCESMCQCACATSKEKIDKIFEMVQALDQKIENKLNTSVVSMDWVESILNNSTRNESTLPKNQPEESSFSESNTCPSPPKTILPEPISSPESTPQEIGDTVIHVDLVEANNEKENQMNSPLESLLITLPQDAPHFNYVLESPQVKVVKEKHFSHACYSGGIVEVCSGLDIRLDRNELRIKADLIRQARINACSVGNFGWILVRKVYANEELVGRNYHGTRGKAALSPRRIHAIEHACLDSYGPGPNVNKMSKAVNTGLRNSDFTTSATSARQVLRPLQS